MQEYVLSLIKEERERQKVKWGVQRHHAEKWFRILGEEFGEIAMAINEHDIEEMYKEIVQTAAVCTAWLEDFFDGGSSIER